MGIYLLPEDSLPGAFSVVYAYRAVCFTAKIIRIPSVFICKYTVRMYVNMCLYICNYVKSYANVCNMVSSTAVRVFALT